MEDDDKLKEERDFAFKTREKTSKGAAGEYFFPMSASVVLTVLNNVSFSL